MLGSSSSGFCDGARRRTVNLEACSGGRQPTWWSSQVEVVGFHQATSMGGKWLDPHRSARSGGTGGTRVWSATGGKRLGYFLKTKGSHATRTAFPSASGVSNLCGLWCSLWTNKVDDRAMTGGEPSQSTAAVASQLLQHFPRPPVPPVHEESAHVCRGFLEDLCVGWRGFYRWKVDVVGVSRCFQSPTFHHFFSPNSLLLGFYLRKKELATLTGRAPELCGWSLWPGLLEGSVAEPIAMSMPTRIH